MILRLKSFFSYNIIKTIYFNFRVLPFSQAKKLPIRIGWHTDIQGAYKGCVKIQKDTSVKRNMISIGITPYPMVSTKSDYTLLRFGKGGIIIFGEDVFIYNAASLIVSENGFISIGNDCLINQRAKIYSQKSIVIGEHFRLGWECQILDSDCHLVYNANKQTIGNPIGGINIGNNVWIASRSSVMKGVTIPSFSIIAGNSLVSKSFADITTQGNLFAGSPAVLKVTGCFRLLNNSFEMDMKKYFMETGDKYISTSDIPNFDYKKYLSRK